MELLIDLIWEVVTRLPWEAIALVGWPGLVIGLVILFFATLVIQMLWVRMSE